MKPLLILFAAITSLTMHAVSPLGGTWLRHPSFYQNVERIVDGKSKTYYLLQQQPFDTRYTDTKLNTATLFVADKTENGNTVEALARKYPFATRPIVALTYSIVTGSLVAVDDRGQILVFPDNSEPFVINGIDNLSLPGRQSIRSITENPDDGTLWIGATYGYTIVDLIAQEIVSLVETEFPVDYVCKVGSKVIVFSNSGAYETDIPSKGLSRGVLSELKASGAGLSSNIVAGNKLTAPSNLMPLSDGSFAFLAPSPEGTAGSAICRASLSSSGWSIEKLTDMEAPSRTDFESPFDLSVALTTPNSEGYLIEGKDKLYQLPREGGGNKLSSVSKPSADNRHWGSYDFKTFRNFINKKGFCSQTYENGEWGKVSDYLWPEGPLPYLVTNMAWSDGVGLIVSGHGFDGMFSNSGPNVPWLISAYKGGKWTNLTPSFTVPDEISSDAAALKEFNSVIERYPLSNPDGFAIDPNNKKYAYAGSMFDGWARINILDPKETALHVGNDENRSKILPGFVTGFKTSEAWLPHCDLSAPRFDAAGNLWFAYSNQDYDSHSEMIAYSSSQIKNMSESSNPVAAYSDPVTFTIPTGQRANKNQEVLALQYPGHENMIVFSEAIHNSPLYILDYNGTLSDKNDDRLAAVTQRTDAESGSPVNRYNSKKMWEDPATGLVWVSSMAGCYTVDPDKAFTRPDKATSFVRVDSDETSGKQKKLFAHDQVNAFAVDGKGRLWIGTHGMGISVISADRKNLLAEITSTNSSLPSDKIYGLCYNKEAGSMMISTDKGLVEFFPDDTGVANSAEVKMSPRNITPGYAGWITFSGLVDGKEYVIVDSSGKVTARPGKASAGTLQWDGLNSSQQMPKTGVYRLCGSDGETEYISFRVLR